MIFSNCLKNNYLFYYFFRYKRNKLIAEYKNYQYDMKIYEEIAEDGRKLKRFEEFCNRSKKIIAEIKNDKCRSKNNKPTKGLMEKSENLNFNKELRIHNGKFVVVNKQLSDIDKIRLENTRNLLRNENKKNNDNK